MPRGGVKRVFLPFQKARAIVLKLGLKSVKEWKEWSKSGERPTNIPSHPDRVYRDKGWVSWPHWLGYECNRKRKRTDISKGSEG